MPEGILVRRATHVVLIIVLGALVYANSLGVPFYFDDAPNIVENPIVKSLSYFTDTDSASGFERYETFRSRFVGFLTFYLNYHFGGLDVTGYHIVNLVIHIIAALLVYALVLLSFSTPELCKSKLFEKRHWVALLASALFVVHPVNTQAVTYIVQRFSSLAALFYLGSMVCYIKARLSASKTGWFYYVVSLISAVLAMKTKESAFTLPLAIALYEFMFFRGETAKKRVLLLAPLMLTMLIIPLTLFDLGKPAAEVMSDISEKTIVHQIPRDTYLLTESRVIATYLRLLVLPMNQNLDYDYPLYTSVTQGPVLMSMVFIAAIVVLAVYLFRRKEPAAKLASFGIVFFFLALSVESTLVPLFPIFEHRAYLPGVGMIMAVSVGTVKLFERLTKRKSKRVLVAMCALGVVALGTMTVVRNTTWRSDLSIWRDVVEKSPNNARGQFNLGIAYRDNGTMEKELSQYRKAVALKPDYAEAHYNLAVRLSQQGKYDEAVQHYRMTILSMPEFSMAYYNLGVAYYLMDRLAEAEKNYRLAQSLDPENPEIHYALGVLYLDNNELEKAILQLQETIARDNRNDKAHYMLGLAYFKKGLYDLAEEELNTSLALSPQYQEAKTLLNNLTK